MKPVKVALIGCGGIAQMGYLPALALVPEVRCLYLVDVHMSLAEGLARRWGIPKITDDYSSILREVEAVVLAVPNHLHTPMVLEAVDRRTAVLCEKPLGRTKEEVHKMVEASHRAGVPLVAGMTFRQYPGLQQIQKAFPWDPLGRVQQVQASYGFPLDWPLSSPYLFEQEKVGGGVLIDQGIHLVDSLFWVLSLVGASVVKYVDDGESRIESDAKAHLTLCLPEGRGQVPCILEVSRLRRLGNRIEILGERASLLVPLSSADAPELREGNGTRPALEHPVTPRSGTRCFAEQLKAFARKVRGLEAACADGESQVKVLELVESCYTVREPLTFSWQDYEPWVES